MKLLFIRPMMSKDMEKEEPLGILYLIMYLRKSIKDIEIEFLDLHILRWDDEKVVNYYIQKGFDILLISTLTICSENVYKIIKLVKERTKTTVILGGPHATALPQDCCRHGADFCCLGEGEIVLPELIKAIMTKQDYAFIPNIVYNTEGGIAYSERRIVPFDINQLLLPDYLLLQDFDSYHTTIHTSEDKRALPIMASRGCMNDCPFCSSKLMWNRKLRYRSATNVFAELSNDISTYGITDFHFLDDDMLSNKAFIMKLTGLIIKSKLKIRYCCLTTVRSIMQLSDDEIEYLKCGGLTVVEVGIESLMERPLQYLRKTYSLDQLPCFVAKTNRHKLDVRPLLMYLVPYETITGYNDASRLFSETLGRIQYLQNNWIIDEFAITRYSSCFTALPGTEFFNEAEKLGVFLENEWSKFDTDSMSFVPRSLLNDIPVKTVKDLVKSTEIMNEISSCSYIVHNDISKDVVEWVWSRIDGTSSVGHLLNSVDFGICDNVVELQKALIYVIILLSESGQIKSKNCDFQNAHPVCH